MVCQCARVEASWRWGWVPGECPKGVGLMSLRPFLNPTMNCKRVDLHCHSRASTEADEAVLQAIRCPESYSEPGEVYAQAKQRGMDFVTITDHDSIGGVEELADRPDVLVGEEVTCYFPEDLCKIHLLVWGITPA